MKTLKIVSIPITIAVIGFSVIAIAGNVQKESQEDSEMGFFEFMTEDMNFPEMIMAHLKERLNLTEEQEAQILPILKENMEKRLAMFRERRDQIRQNVQAIETEHQAMLQETEQQLATILTEEQMQELRKIRDEHIGMREGFAKRMDQRRGKFREVLKELNLSAEQKKEIFSIFMKYRDTHKDARENFLEIRTQFGNMALEMLKEDFNEEKVRQTYRESTAKMEEFVVTGAKMFAEMKAVLTPEQLELLQQKGSEFLTSMQDHPHARGRMFFSWLRFHRK
jgi:Spy/CpxP family protein refolding chaperone